MIGRGRELEVLAGWFRDRATGGMLLTGGAGVGKTRLAEQVLELAEAAGMPNARVSGHPEGRSIPFAALSHLLPIDVASPTGPDDLDRGAVFHRAAAALREQAGDERLLLLVDDGDQLDDLSRALVASLVHSRGVFAVVTMRTTGGPTPFDHLVKDGHLLRLTVEPLPVESIETLLHRVLGGPIVAESLGRLRDAAMGNPGVLRQLVETAREAGVLTELNGVWRLVGPLQPTASFEDLVAERLRGRRRGRLAAARRRGRARPRRRRGDDRRRGGRGRRPGPRQAPARPALPAGRNASTHSAWLKRPASAPSSIASAISVYMRRHDSSAPDVQPSPTTAPIAAIRASPTKT